MAPDAKAIADAFVRGVNAWVRCARDRPPEEFALAGWKPELWSPEDLLNRTDAFTSSGDALDEVFRARLVATVGVARARLLLSGSRALDVPAALDPALVPDVVAEAIRRAGTPPFFLGLAVPVTEGTVRVNPDASPVADAGEVRTEPNPALRYIVHLNAPGWNVIGAVSPWRPASRSATTIISRGVLSRSSLDTQDLYVEKVNPANERQVEDRGRWVDVALRTDSIAVRGHKAPLAFERQTTSHGVIVASDRERHLAFALRWSGTEPGAAAELAAPALESGSVSGGVRRRRFHDGRCRRGASPTRRSTAGAIRRSPGWRQ